MDPEVGDTEDATLHISCTDLPISDLDAPNAMVCVYLQTGGSTAPWVFQAATEAHTGKPSPIFTEGVKVPFKFAELQMVMFKVIDVWHDARGSPIAGPYNGVSGDEIALCVCPLSAVVADVSALYRAKLLDPVAFKEGRAKPITDAGIQIQVELQHTAVVELTLKAALDNDAFFKLADASGTGAALKRKKKKRTKNKAGEAIYYDTYFKLFKSRKGGSSKSGASKKTTNSSRGEWEMIWASEVMKQTLTPQWMKIHVPSAKLCNDDLTLPLKIEVYNCGVTPGSSKKKARKHTLIGAVSATLAELIEGLDDDDDDFDDDTETETESESDSDHNERRKAPRKKTKKSKRKQKSYSSDSGSDSEGEGGYASKGQDQDDNIYSTIALSDANRRYGKLFVSTAKLTQDHSLLDYLRAGTQLNYSVAIDFTSTNRKHTSKQSLHYIDGKKKYMNNQYSRCIKAVGSRLERYAGDADDYPYQVWGFGAEDINGDLSKTNCFNVNLNEKDPSVKGVGGVLQAYGECLDKITMSSPTYINEIIAAASKHAVKLYPIVRRSNSTTAPGMGRGKGTKNRKKHSPTGDAGDGDGNGDGSDSDDDGDDNEGSGEHSDVDEHVRPCYTVLLVLVDNVIDDFVQTMRQIELSSFDPISIVVIGVGKANFSAMEPLNQSVANNAEGGDASSSSSSSGGSTGRDSEGKHHGHNSSTKRRDIIQFLRYRDHAANDTRRGSKGDAGSDSSRSSNAGDVEGQASGIDELARLALAKVPSQFLSFVRSHGIEPPPILPHLSIEVPRVYDVPMPCYTVGNTRVDDAGELYLVCRVYDDEDEIVYEYKQPHQTNSSDDDSDGEDGEGEESDDEDAGGEIIRDWVSINQLRPSDRSGGTSDNDANADGDGDTGDAIVSRKDRKKAQRKNAELLRESERVHCKTRHFIVECERGDKADAGKDMTELLLGKNKSKLNKKKRKMRKKQKSDEEGRLDRISDWSSLSYVEISLWRRVFRAQKKTSSKRNSKTTTRKMSRRKSKKMKNKDKDAEPDSDSEVDSDNDDNLASGDDSKDSMLVSNPDDLVSLTKIDLVDVDDNDSEGAGRHELTLPFDDEVVCGSVKARIHFSSGGQLLPVVLKRQRKASVSKQKEHARYRAKAERKRAKREKEEMAEADKEMTTIMKEVRWRVQAQVQKLESQRQAAVDQEKARLAIEALKQKEVDEKKRQTLAKMKEAKALTQAEEIVAQRKLKEKEEAEKAKLIQREEEMAKTDPIFRYGNELRKQREVARMKKEIEDKKEALSCALGPHQARKVIEPNPFSMKLKEKKRVEGMSTREQNKLKARYIQESGILMSFEWAMSRLLTCPLWENGYDHAMEPMLYEFMAQQLEEFDESWNSFSHSSPLYSQMKIEQVKIKQRDARKKQVKKEKQEARRQGVDLNKSYSSGHSRQRRGSTFGGGISRTPMNQSIRGSVSAKKPGRKNSEKWVPLSQKKWRLKENSTPQDRQTAGNNDARYGQHEDGNNTSGVNPSNDGGARGLYHYRNDRQNDGYSGDGDGQMRDLSQSMKNVHLNASPSPNTNLSQSFQSPYAKTRPNNIGTENDKGYNTSQYGGHGKEGYGSPQYGNGNYSGSYDSYGDSGYNTHHDNRGNNDNDGYNSNHNNGSGGNGYPSGHFNGNQHPPSQHQNQHQNQHNQNWHNNDYTSNNNNNKNNAGVQDATRFPPLSPSSQQYNNYNNNNDSGNSRYHDNGGKNGQADSHINSVETGVGAGTNNGGAANNGSAFVRKRR